MVFGSGFPVPTVLNILWSLGLVSLSHCVESHIWSLPIYGLWVRFPCPNCVESYGLRGLVSLSHCVESYGLWVRFPCPTVLNPIYGLCPYMVFGVRFPCPTVLNPIYGLWVWFPCPNCVEYPMVFGSGFLVPLC